MSAEKWGPGGGNGPQPNLPDNPYFNIHEEAERTNETLARAAQGPICEFCFKPVAKGDGFELRHNNFVHRIHAACNLACPVCSETVTHETGGRYRNGRALHTLCTADYEILLEKQRLQWEEDHKQSRIREARRSYNGWVESQLRALPDFHWADVDSPLFERSVKDKKLRALARKWTPERGSLLLLGPTDIGKTNCVIATIRRFAREYEPAFRQEQMSYDRGIFGDVVWTTGAAVTFARRYAALGSEPELIVKCKEGNTSCCG